MSGLIVGKCVYNNAQDIYNISISAQIEVIKYLPDLIHLFIVFICPVLELNYQASDVALPLLGFCLFLCVTVPISLLNLCHCFYVFIRDSAKSLAWF